LKRALREAKRALVKVRSQKPVQPHSRLGSVRRWVAAGLRRVR